MSGGELFSLNFLLETSNFSLSFLRNKKLAADKNRKKSAITNPFLAISGVWVTKEEERDWDNHKA